MIQKCGPKKVLLIASLTFTIGWLLLLQQIFILNSLLFIRFFNGASVALSSIALIVYLQEISLPSNRGIILSSFTTATTLGTAVPALYCLHDAYLYTVLALCFNLLGTTTLYLLPESPLWMLKSCSNDPENLYEAEKALQCIRSTTSSDSCATLFEISHLAAEKEHFAGFSLSDPLFYRPLRLLICVVMLIQATFFANIYRLFGLPMTVLLEYFDDSEATNKSANTTLFLKVDTSASIFALIQLATGLTVIFLLVRFLERRTVLVFSGGMMLLMQFILGIAVLNDAKEKKKSLQMLKSVVQYMAVILATIIESIGWLVIAELPIHKHRTNSVVLSWVASWILTALTISLADTYAPLNGSFFFFITSLTMAFAVGVLFTCMPKKLRGQSCSQVAVHFTTLSKSLSHISL